MRRFFIRPSLWFAIAAWMTGTQPDIAQTWIQWKSADGGNNHYYALTLSATNWTAAQDMAVCWGGTLATITSSNEQNFINATFLTGRFEHLPLWIGLRRANRSISLGRLQVQIGFHPKDEFRWVTGEAFSYTNWKSGEPSDSAPGENCVAINWEYSDAPPRGVKGDWNDTPWNGTTGYGGKTDGPYFGLVERDPNPPAKAGFQRYHVYVGLVAMFVTVIIICLARFRGNEGKIRAALKEGTGMDDHSGRGMNEEFKGL